MQRFESIRSISVSMLVGVIMISLGKTALDGKKSMLLGMYTGVNGILLGIFKSSITITDGTTIGPKLASTHGKTKVG